MAARSVARGWLSGNNCKQERGPREKDPDVHHPSNPRRRRARKRIDAARRAAAELLEQRRRELRRDLEQRTRELDADRPETA